jgi:AcrR family transcriptional regulator
VSAQMPATAPADPTSVAASRAGAGGISAAAGSPKPAKRMTAQMSGEDTRAKIIAAVVETLHAEGIVGTSARAIARRGDFNQALIFYHFGSVEGLLAAAAISEGERRAAVYADRFGQISTLGELVSVAREVHENEQRGGIVNVLTQMLAGSASSPGLRSAIFDGIQPWLELVEQAVGRVVGTSSVGSLVSMHDVAFAISSLFLGFELMTAADPEGVKATALFDSIERVASVVETLLQATR